jgi:hypothetical protein
MSGAAASPATETGVGSAPAAPTAPSPLKVGVAFVKQYYQILTSQPDQIVKFYIPKSSYLSHGEGSDPTNPQSLEEYNLNPERWGCGIGETMRFELEHGAIDAQPSVNDGILLVVTGQVIFRSSDKDAKSAGSQRKAFVHTFFLAKNGRNFAVNNDVLRFLQVPLSPAIASINASKETSTTDTSTNTILDTADVGIETDPVEKEESKVDISNAVDKDVVTVIADVNAHASDVGVDDDEAPGGGVEESKEEPPEEDEEVGVVDPSGSDGAGTDKIVPKNQPLPPKQQPASKPVPGSWASLVASGGSAPNTPSRKPPQPDKLEQSAEPTKSVVATTHTDSDNKSSKDGHESGADNGSSNQTRHLNTISGGNNNNPTNSKRDQLLQRPKRDPDCTLVIKNLSDSVKEADMINMFQPFAVQTKANILGTNLNHHRGLAFVDFDSVAPVMAALQQHSETPFEWNGKTLEVDQKTAEQRSRKNNGFRNGGGGGRDQFRRGGGGDRGGRRTGNRGGRTVGRG